MDYEKFYQENFKRLLYVAMLTCLVGAAYSFFAIGGKGGTVMMIMFLALEFFIAGVLGALQILIEGKK